MKKTALLLCMISIMSLLACGSEFDANKNDSLINTLALAKGLAESNGSSVSATGAVVVDHNGVTLGNLVFMDLAVGVAIVTNTGYFVFFRWDGSIQPASQLENAILGFLFTTNDCNAGDPTQNLYAMLLSTGIFYGKFVVNINGNLYVPNATNADGTAVVTTPAIPLYSVAPISDMVCSGYTDPIPIETFPENGFIELKNVSRATVGLPATIATPITVVAE